MTDGFDRPVPPRAKRGLLAPTIAVLALGAAGGTGYYAWQQRGQMGFAQGERARLEKENATLAQTLETQRASGGEAGDKLAACADELATEKEAAAGVNAKVADMEARLAACAASADAAAKESAAAQSQVEQLKAVTGKFQKMIDAGDLDVAYRRGRMVVKLPDAILFPSGKAVLSDTGTVAIAQVAAVLKQLPDRDFLVVGHTDSVPIAGGAFKSNWELSAARAVAVTELLVKMGIPPERLVAAGHGSHDPVSSNSTKTGRAKNRRIEIVLEPEVRKVAVKGK